MRDLLAQDGVGGQTDGVEEPGFFQPHIDRGDRVGSVGPEEASTKVAASISGNDGIKDIPPAIGAVDIAVTQGAALQHAKLVEQEDGVIAGAVEMPVPGSTFLIAVGGADRAVHVQHDVFQPVAVMKPVDPLAVQIGQRRPVRGQSQRLGLEPSHLRCRSSLRLDGPAANDLTHHGIEGQAVGIVHILVSGQSSEHRLPEQSVKPMERVLPGAAVSQRLRRQIGQAEHVIKLAHHQQATV